MHLVLFFTRGISLQTWDQVGSLGREIAIYQRLTEKGVGVSFITYGGARDLEFQNQLGEIRILCNQWDLPLHWYERLMPILHAKTLFDADLFKSNQINGADVALRAAKIFRKPLIARCGYMWSDLANASGRYQDAIHAKAIEKTVFSEAKFSVVTTPRMKDYVIREHEISEQQINVIPNYVLTDVFSPGNRPHKSKQICYIGRLSEEKNLFSLMRACAGLDVELLLVGDGPLRDPLEELADELKVNISMPGNIEHRRLPEIIRNSVLFVLVSPHEGHPKSLLEAMACGIPVIGADSPGIREQIVHGATGWLVNTDAESIHAGIQHLLSNPQLCEGLGRKARDFVLDNYSLEKIFEQEYSLLTQIAGDIH